MSARQDRTPGRAARRATGLPLVIALAAARAATVVAAAEPLQLNATSSEPRAYGYQVGDVASRTVTVQVPDGLTLDASSVPRPGARGRALELRSVARRDSAEAGGRRLELTLDYQVFLSPPQPRTLEMPSFRLQFKGRPRDQEIRIEAWPVAVSPLTPPEASPRRGLGELQPDAPPPLIDTTAGRNRLIAYGAVMLAAIGYLAYLHIGLPWRSRAQRPFTQAWRLLRRLTPDSPEAQWRHAIQGLHLALNRTAGQAVFEPGIDRFVTAQPRFRPLRDDLITFFRHSRREFFEPDSRARADRAWLIEFGRRCRDAERGSA